MQTGLMKMKRLRHVALTLASAVLLVSVPASANGIVFPQTVINFDTDPSENPIASGTVVNSVYASKGVTFEKVGPGTICGSGPEVYANNNQPPGFGSPPNLVSTCSPPIAADISENGFGMIHAILARPASLVCIDVRPDEPSDFAVMRSYDAFDNLLTSATSTPGDTESLCISGAQIRGVRFSGSGDQFAMFDNFGVTFLAVTDFDTDGNSDVAVYQTSTGNWFWVGSTSGFDSHLGFGGSNYTPVPGDYDGDGKTDTAVYDTTNGNWFISQTTAGFTVHPSFGGSGYIPVPGDYDGDGKVDIAVYETSSGNWFYVGSTSGFGSHLGFGGTNFIPVPADYDGDGVTDTAVYDMTTGNWFIAQTTAGFTIHPSFGGSGYIPVPGDYDGDGKTDIAVYETTSGNWFYVGSTSGFGSHLGFGGPTFTPVPGDYDGDGKTDTSVYDTTNGNWFIDQTTAGFTIHPSFGGPGYVPVVPQVTILRALGLL